MNRNKLIEANNRLSIRKKAIKLWLLYKEGCRECRRKETIKVDDLCDIFPNIEDMLNVRSNEILKEIEEID